MSRMQDQVKDFHQAFDAPAPDHVTGLTPDRAELRLELIREELKELTEAFGQADDGQVGPFDIVEAYDACIDLLYVVLGTLVEMGLDAEPGFEEVHASNMSKLGDDGKPIVSRGEELDGFPAGKVLKGPFYWKPELRAIVLRQIMDKNVDALHDAAVWGVRDGDEQL